VACARVLLVALVAAMVCAAVSTAGCGGDEGYAQRDLELTFDQRELPEGTAKIRYFVLPGILSDQTEIDCFNFIGEDPPDKIYDFSAEFIDRATVDVDATLGRAEVIIEDLPAYLLIFYVEALDAGTNVIACGCGKGTIEAGKKKIIAIRLVAGC